VKRVAFVGWLLGTFLAAGCYNPNIPNLGFACSIGQSDPCPDGFRCIEGRCSDAPAGGSMDLAKPAVDLLPPAGDIAPAPDLATTSDMTAPADLTTPADLTAPPDLTTPRDLASSCGATGAACTRSSECCSGHCHSRSTFVCY
jgi:hypothetical protein